MVDASGDASEAGQAHQPENKSEEAKDYNEQGKYSDAVVNQLSIEEIQTDDVTSLDRLNLDDKSISIGAIQVRHAESNSSRKQLDYPTATDAHNQDENTLFPLVMSNIIDELYKCANCGIVCESLVAYHNHTKQKHLKNLNAPFKCAYCSKTFNCSVQSMVDLFVIHLIISHFRGE